MIKNTFISLCLFFSLAASGQNEGDIKISGNFYNSTFQEFVNEMENLTQLKFYYQPEWIKDIKITFSGTNVNLASILNNQLLNTELQYLIDGNNVYIYPGDKIITVLPTFNSINIENAIPDTSEMDNLTESEKKYQEGKKISAIEVLDVGDKNKPGGASGYIVDGSIVDEENSEPLIGATIYIEELKSGTVTDSDGKFKLVLKRGKYKAIFNYMSMKPVEYYLQVYSDGSVYIKMRKELHALDEVTIAANHVDNIRGIQMGYKKISAKTIKELPVVFGEKDVLKVAQMLPGVVNVGEGSAGFNVRGSAEDQNMFYINKIPVYNTSHLFGFFSSFNPDIINDFTLYKSNIPANFGGRLSSIFDITTRQGNKNKFFTQGGINPITAHASFEIPVIKGKVSVVTSFRSSYSNWILKQIKDENISKSRADFYDGSFSINAELNDKNHLKGFFYISNDKFSLASINDFNYTNLGSSLSLKHVFTSSASVNFAILYSGYSFENTDKTNLSTAYIQNYRINHYEVKTDFSLLTRRDHKINFGLSSIYYNLNRGKIIPLDNKSLTALFNRGIENGLESAIYLSDEFPLFNNLSVLAGIRYSIFSQLGPETINLYSPDDYKTPENLSGSRKFKKGDLIKTYSGPEYRLALNYLLGNNSSVKVSYNRLYQYIFMLRSTIAISPNDQWKLCDYYISPPVADQISIGYYKDFNNEAIKSSVELYHKWINNQVEFKDGSDFASPYPIETQVLQGKQKAYGIEFMINKEIGKTTGWVSYTYSRSLIKIYDELAENRINYGREYPANYDRPNSFNFVLNHKINRRLSYSTNFVYITGRPITLPISIYYIDNQQLLEFSTRNEYRIPDYLRLDLSLILEGNLNRKKPIHSYWSLNLYNALGRANTYSVYYDSKKGIISGHKLSIFGVPIFTLSWNYKFGNYLND